MTRHELSNDVAMLRCYIDKMKQMDGARAIKLRKRQERRQINLSKFRRQIKC